MLISRHCYEIYHDSSPILFITIRNSESGVTFENHTKTHWSRTHAHITVMWPQRGDAFRFAVVLRCHPIRLHWGQVATDAVVHLSVHTFLSHACQNTAHTPPHSPCVCVCVRVRILEHPQWSCDLCPDWLQIRVAMVWIFHSTIII